MSSSFALKANGTLLHRQLFLILRQEILQGRYRTGDRLPTQEVLCHEFSVSRITVRRALADLQAEGLIRNEQGVGAFVTHAAPQRPPPANLDYVDSFQQGGEPTTIELLDHRLQPATRHVAERLELPVGTDVLYIARIRRHRGEPVLYTEAWLPARFNARLSPEALRRESLSGLLVRSLPAVGRIIEEINAEVAHPAVAQALEVEPNSPILRRERTVHDDGQHPILYLVARSSGLRSRMLLEAEETDGFSVRNGLLIHDLGQPQGVRPVEERPRVNPHHH